jgi:hypothetical protein
VASGALRRSRGETFRTVQIIGDLRAAFIVGTEDGCNWNERIGCFKNRF